MNDTLVNVAVVFGGTSPEHEVSVISSHQAIAALDPMRYRPVPVYLSKDGSWYIGESLKNIAEFQNLDQLCKKAERVVVGFEHNRLKLIPENQPFIGRKSPVYADVVLLGLHGGAGEDGGLQGLCETFNVPYTGSGVFASALGMDKEMSKHVCRQLDIPVVDFLPVHEHDWQGNEESVMASIESTLGYSMVVKPARLGSSIGISFATNRAELDQAIEEAFRYDSKIVVEKAVDNLVEINCSVLGDLKDALPSVLEQPVADSEDLLSFGDKYMRGSSGGKGRKSGGAVGMASLDRIIPAPLGETATREIQELAVRVFQSFECAGLARIDFLTDSKSGEVFFNEINTIPGSFSFYLWDKLGVDFSELMHRLIQLAMRRHQGNNSRVRSYDVNLLSSKNLSGLKGAKG